MGKKDKTAKEKSLDKMTATELRAVAMEIPGITGAHGMNKTELLSSIRKAKGIEEAPSKKTKPEGLIRNAKAKIRELKKKRVVLITEANKKLSDITRRRISRLKKMTRRSA